MANEGGEWIMKGLDWNDPYRIRSWRELINWINEVGFLPLFANEVPGFSAEEHVSPLFWWTGDPEQDPWVWREIIPSPVKWYTASSSITRPDSFPGSGSLTLQTPGGTDMTSMRHGMTNWSSAAIRRSWMSLRMAACIPALN